MRLKDSQDSEMTDEQRRMVREAANGKRGHMPAPMRAWLHSPQLAERAQRLGEFVRYDTSLEPKLSELAILAVARFWTSHYEWHVHKREAQKVGLDSRIVEAIRDRKQPDFFDERERLVYLYATTLLNEQRIPEALHEAAVAQLGVASTVELVGIFGYYSLVAMTLNAFAFELPAGAAHELEEPAA